MTATLEELDQFVSDVAYAIRVLSDGSTRSQRQLLPWIKKAASRLPHIDVETQAEGMNWSLARASLANTLSHAAELAHWYRTRQERPSETDLQALALNVARIAAWCSMPVAESEAV